MREHTKIYYEAFGYDTGIKDQFIPSEIDDKKRAVDIHHIVTREDRIENLMGLTRIEHEDFGDKRIYMVYLLKIHRRRLDLANIPYNNKWFEFYINRYENLV